MPSFPPNLAPVRAYLDRASELSGYPLVSHQLRLVATTVGVHYVKDDQESKRLLLGLMDTLEEERLLQSSGYGPAASDPAAAPRALARDLYNRALAADRPDGMPSPTA